MKYCPTCRSNYTDDTLKFCLQDGTLLVSDPGAETETPTIAFGDRTERFPSKDEPTERFTTNKDIDQLRIDVPDASRQNSWQQSRETVIAAPPPAPQKSNTLVAVLATALVMLILFGAAGFGAWLYFSKDRTGLSNNTNREANSGEKIISNNNSNKESPTPTAAKKDSTPVKTETPPPNFNAEEVEKEVSERIYSWNSLAESRDLNAYMENYADKLDYYTKKGVSAEAVRSDKQRAFTQYDSIKMTLSNLTVTPDSSGDTATAVFDKAWVFQNYEKTSEGKVRTQLKLRKIGGAWKITGERDLRVYFVK